MPSMPAAEIMSRVAEPDIICRVRVLVVEDEAKLANLLRRGLRREGMAVDVASDGEAALTRATSTAYDVILLDVMLPGGDGLELCRALRARDVWSPTLMLTALG